MRIATWNINGVRARVDYIQKWLDERQPDIVCFQELKSLDEQFPSDVFTERGYHAVTHGQKAWNGVAILSKTEPKILFNGLPGQEDAGARLIAARYGDLDVISVYCPNGKNIDHPDFELKLAWYDDLISFITEFWSPNDNLVLCGDFNIVPAAIDAWHDGQGCHFTDAERRRYRQLLTWGFSDVYRNHHDEAPGYTWWDYRFGAFHKKQGLRIDWLLATRSVDERVVFVNPDRDWRKKVDDLTPSDHAPLYMDIRAE